MAVKGKRINKRKSGINYIAGAFMLVFAVIVCVNVGIQLNRYSALKETEAQITMEIEDEQLRSVELKAQQEYYMSDDYIESVARNQLGLIKPDERVFINKSDE